MHAAFARNAIALFQVAVLARGDDVVPSRAPAARSRNDVIEGQVFRIIPIPAILTAKAIAQKNIEAGKGRAFRPTSGSRLAIWLSERF